MTNWFMNWFKHQPAQLHPAAITAAHWWSECLRDDQNRFHVADDSRLGANIAIMAALARNVGSQTGPTEEQIQSFEQYLATAISAELSRFAKRVGKRNPVWLPSITLSVDWAPEGLLSDALLAANASQFSMALPTQSCMHVRDGQVRVSPGYRDEYVDVPIE